jgi:hypothetical protein
MSSKLLQAPSLVGVVVGGVLAMIIGVIVIYAVGFPVLINLNTSGSVPVSQLSNFNTVLLLLGVMAILIAQKDINLSQNCSIYVRGKISWLN